LAEGDPNLEQEDSAPQVENLFGNAEDSKEEALNPEDPSLSQQDEARTEGKESSYGHASNFAAVPNLQRLVLFGSDHCLLATSKTRSASRHRIFVAREPRPANSMWSIVRKATIVTEKGLTAPVSLGFSGHGLARGPYYTHKQFQELKSMQREEN
jgi:hypothetical protein